MTTKKTTKKVVKKPPKKKKPVAKKTKQKEKKNDLMLVHNPTNKEQEFFISCEIADDRVIEAELLGQAMEHFIYQYKDKRGNLITGLSVTGVNEMARRLTKNQKSGIKVRIVPDSVKIERDIELNKQKGIQVTLIAENMVTGEIGVGVKFEPYEAFGKNGKYPNTFVLEKALSKAERNAKRKLIPEKAAIEMIKLFVKQQKTAQITNGYQPNNQLQKPSYQQAPAIKTPNQTTQLIKYLASDAKIEIKGKITEEQAKKMIEIYNNYTGDQVKSLRVGEERAKQMLINYLSSPMKSSDNKK